MRSPPLPSRPPPNLPPPPLLLRRIPLPPAAIMKDRGGLYVPPHQRAPSTISAHSLTPSPQSVSKPPSPFLPPRSTEPSISGRNYLQYNADSLLNEGAGREVDVKLATDDSASDNDNIEKWKYKLKILLHNQNEQEVVSREKKDRRDFDQIAAFASQLGLYSQLYNKAAVFSKVPLPNYRYDMDDKRPQREVSLPQDLLRKLKDYLNEYNSQKTKLKEEFPDYSFSRCRNNNSISSEESLFEQPEPLSTCKLAMEIALTRSSLQLQEQQQAWQDSLPGRKILGFRRGLPAYKEKNLILTAISQNQVVIISGETGCGKTTQIPQYILESEIDSDRGAFCNIICTQPRRISAITVSERVALERGEELGESVGYKVRLEGKKGRGTRLLFCTTGILLRRLLVDSNLKGITHVVVDEIHERGMNEDFLLIILKDLLPRRCDLRLILMSATLDAELFSSYFGGAPIIHISGFTYPVRTYFLEDLLEMTGYKLTPSNQIDDYGQDKIWKMSKQASRKRKSPLASVVEGVLEAANLRSYSPETRASLSCWNPECIGFSLIEYLLTNICNDDRPGAVLVFMTGWDDISSLKEKLQTNPIIGDPDRVLLLACHGSMASSEQVIVHHELERDRRQLYIISYHKIIGKEKIIAQIPNKIEHLKKGIGVKLVLHGRFCRELSHDVVGLAPTLKDKCTSFDSLCATTHLIHIFRLIFEQPTKGVRKVILATNIAETSITINDVVFVIDCGKAKETSYDALNKTPCLLPSWISRVSAQQRRGRAGRVQPGECYHLYPKCVYDAFVEYQLPEILRTPLQSICVQIKSLKLGRISGFLSRALQSPEPLAVENAIEYLKLIGALDEDENLTVLGHYLATLPLEPKLGKMLILGGILNCLDPILTIVAGLSVRDPFLAPLDKKDLADAAKEQFAHDYSDHISLLRAYEGWKNAEINFSGYDYCWKNFLSLQSMREMDILRKYFLSLLKDSGLLDGHKASDNSWTHKEDVIRAIICYGLFPNICSVVPSEKSFSLKTMEDGQVLLHSSSANARKSQIPHPWLVFNQKIKVKSIFLRDSTALSDSVLLLFGGSISHGDMEGHLKMLEGYLDFFMDPSVADIFCAIKEQLDHLIQSKLLNPRIDIFTYHRPLLSAVNMLLAKDLGSGRFIYCHKDSMLPKSNVPSVELQSASIPQIESCPGGNNSKSQLQTLLARAGHPVPVYKTKQLKNGQFQTTVEFNGMEVMGQPYNNKKSAEKDAAAVALQWLMGGKRPDVEYINQMSILLKKRRKDHH